MKRSLPAASASPVQDKQYGILPLSQPVSRMSSPFILSRQCLLSEIASGNTIVLIQALRTYIHAVVKL